MPYVNTNTLTANDMNNVLRGLFRDNSDYAVTGTTAETNMASTTLTANTLGATGALHIMASGTVTDVGGAAKDIRLYFGATAVATISRTGANAQDWLFDAWCYNTATGAQRWHIVYSTADAVTRTADYTTSAIDTTANVTIKVTGDLAGATDTITQKTFDIFIVQIT